MKELTMNSTLPTGDHWRRDAVDNSLSWLQCPPAMDESTDWARALIRIQNWLRFSMVVEREFGTR